MIQKPAIYVVVGVVALAFVMALTARPHQPDHVATSSPAPLPQPSREAEPASPAASPESVQAAAPAASEDIVIPPLPADAHYVPDAYLLKLSAMVNLPNAEERHIDKDQWSRAVPIAERLVQAPSDCEQRNWLSHFIAMGNDAIHGSEEDIYQQAGLMRKMARNDKQLTDHVFAN